jgi:uncharacterized membrane protein
MRFKHLAVTIVLTRLALGERVRQLRAVGRDDRGEGPVSTAIMVALIAAAALLVAGLITVAATNWANRIPNGN